VQVGFQGRVTGTGGFYRDWASLGWALLRWFGALGLGALGALTLKIVIFYRIGIFIKK
jgi:hypothetical protein